MMAFCRASVLVLLAFAAVLAQAISPCPKAGSYITVSTDTTWKLSEGTCEGPVTVSVVKKGVRLTVVVPPSGATLKLVSLSLTEQSKLAFKGGPITFRSCRQSSGGAISAYNSQIEFFNRAAFFDNVSTDRYTSGGAIALHAYGTTKSTIVFNEDVTFAGNYAFEGGGIAIDEESTASFWGTAKLYDNKAATGYGAQGNQLSSWGTVHACFGLIDKKGALWPAPPTNSTEEDWPLDFSGYDPTELTGGNDVRCCHGHGRYSSKGSGSCACAAGYSGKRCGTKVTTKPTAKPTQKPSPCAAVHGITHPSNPNLCCAASCGVAGCGTAKCSQAPRRQADCCGSAIVAANRACARGQAPCVVKPKPKKS